MKVVSGPGPVGVLLLLPPDGIPLEQGFSSRLKGTPLVPLWLAEYLLLQDIVFSCRITSWSPFSRWVFYKESQAEAQPRHTSQWN